MPVGRPAPPRYSPSAVLERGEHVLALEVRVVGEHFVDRSPRPAAQDHPTVIPAVSRIVGSPPIRPGSTPMRSIAMPKVYARPPTGHRQRDNPPRTRPTPDRHVASGEPVPPRGRRAGYRELERGDRAPRAAPRPRLASGMHRCARNGGVSLGTSNCDPNPLRSDGLRHESSRSDRVGANAHSSNRGGPSGDWTRTRSGLPMGVARKAARSRRPVRSHDCRFRYRDDQAGLSRSEAGDRTATMRVSGRCCSPGQASSAYDEAEIVDAVEDYVIEEVWARTGIAPAPGFLDGV